MRSPPSFAPASLTFFAPSPLPRICKTFTPSRLPLSPTHEKLVYPLYSCLSPLRFPSFSELTPLARILLAIFFFLFSQYVVFSRPQIVTSVFASSFSSHRRDLLNVSAPYTPCVLTLFSFSFNGVLLSLFLFKCQCTSCPLAQEDLPNCSLSLPSRRPQSPSLLL